MTKRRLVSWTEAFFNYTEQLPSPSLFRKWAAISIVAGALERRVWVRSYASNLYPNLYTILVGPPGVGKTVLTSQIFALWSELEDHHLASSSVTKAAMIDDLHEAERRLIRPQETPSIITYNSLKVCSNELGVLIPGYENDFMNTLTDIYDGHPYSERRRSKDIQFAIDHPQINLVAATTPSYLNNMLPEGAWDQGFLSRTLLIYSGESIVRPLFIEESYDKKIWKDLIFDLKAIGELYGKMTFSEEARNVVTRWHMDGGPPQPEHPKLVHYNTRRTAHLLKLCMVACASHGDILEITIEHVQEALDWLIEAETFMPDIFKSMRAGGDSRAIEDCWYHIYRIYMKEAKPIAEHRIIHYLQERVPVHNVSRILEVMTKSGILKREFDGYVPKPIKQD